MYILRILHIMASSEYFNSPNENSVKLQNAIMLQYEPYQILNNLK